MGAGTAFCDAAGCDACTRGVAGACDPGKHERSCLSVTRKDSRSWLRMLGGRQHCRCPVRSAAAKKDKSAATSSPQPASYAPASLNVSRTASTDANFVASICQQNAATAALCCLWKALPSLDKAATSCSSCFRAECAVGCSTTIRRFSSISDCCDAVSAPLAASHTAASHFDKESTTLPPDFDPFAAAWLAPTDGFCPRKTRTYLAMQILPGNAVPSTQLRALTNGHRIPGAICHRSCVFKCNTTRITRTNLEPKWLEPESCVKYIFRC